MKYRFKDEAESVSIKIYDEIGDDGWGNGITANDISDQLANANSKPLNIYINSYGGEVFEGFAIYNSIKNYKGYKTVYIDGIAASISSVIAMAGDKVIMNEASMLMIHNASGIAYGNADEMQKVVNALNQINEVIRDVFIAKTHMDESRIQEIMDNETYLKPQECLEMGFCDEVRYIEVSKESVDTSVNNLLDMFTNRIEQLRSIKNIGFEAPTQDGISIADEGIALNKKSKMDWLKNGGIF